MGRPDQKMMQAYESWKQLVSQAGDRELLSDLEDIDQEQIYERFYKDIEFGTGGLRGILGAGPNRMNSFTVARTTRGLADYIKAGHYIADMPIKGESPYGREKAVAIAYDSRNNSGKFAWVAAGILEENGIKVYIYDYLMPTPALSYAVRRHSCAMGIMITASHNPAEYNGYKVYDATGCQLTLEAADKMYALIEKVDILEEPQILKVAKAWAGVSQVKEGSTGTGLITVMGQEDFDSYLEAVMSQSTLKPEKQQLLKDLRVVYTPLNGAGNKPVRAMFEKCGISHLQIVKEQENPDGNFPTCPYPNPEKEEALKQGLDLCRKLQSEAEARGKAEDAPHLLIATDPDSDRVGVMVRHQGAYRRLTGNQVGILLTWHKLMNMPEKAGEHQKVVISTIVSTDMIDDIAEKAGARVIRTLTGFKFIGEQLAYMEEAGRLSDYAFGFEESYGYLTGGYVRDKDAVSASLVICELAALMLEKGKTLLDLLEELYETYGYHLDDLMDFKFEGSEGMKIMAGIMERFRKEKRNSYGGVEVKEIIDYEDQKKYDLPKTNAYQVALSDGCLFTARPSGTEPKLKIYLSSKGASLQEAKDRLAHLRDTMTEFMESQK